MVSASRRPPRLLWMAAAFACVSACSRPETATPTPPDPVTTVAPPAAPLPPPPLGRAELLGAAAEAASAHASGTQAEAPAALSGRPFRLRLPFGCVGPSEPGALAYSYDKDRGVLRVTARPEVWTGTPLGAMAAGDVTVEAVEGFWIRRPWLLADGCPARPALVPGAAAETVGLAQVFESADSRLRRRGGRPYELTRKADLDPGWLAGFRLVLEGRIAEAGRRPIRCRSEHSDQRPVCLILVEIDRVAVETAAGEQLAEWDR